jgi:hypothetical protein
MHRRLQHRVDLIAFVSDSTCRRPLIRSVSASGSMRMPGRLEHARSFRRGAARRRYCFLTSDRFSAAQAQSSLTNAQQLLYKLE